MLFYFYSKNRFNIPLNFYEPKIRNSARFIGLINRKKIYIISYKILLAESELNYLGFLFEGDLGESYINWKWNA